MRRERRKRCSKDLSTDRHQWSGTPPTSKEEEHMSAVIRADGTVIEGPDQEQVMTTTHDEITTVDDLTTWTEARVLMLAEDGGTLPFLRGYAAYASGKSPDSASVAGLPFEACDYHEGYALASYELGNLTTAGHLFS
jgi:hypothetical protein